MKITFGRKFLACLVALIILCGMFFTAIVLNDEAITEKVMIFFGAMVVTVCFAYIGGNVWNSWVKSKYFRPELKE